MRTRSDWDAADYAANSSAQAGWAEELITKLALRATDSVLDVGCGDGKITARLAQIVKDGRALGIDTSESMIRRASEQFPANVFPNLSFRLMDAAGIHLAERFDIAFSNATLHWVQDQVAVLRGVRRCLRPGGRSPF